ncbi:hypothetical protein [Streptomyces sp. uw30]|nr:hypothetical protein [Streptomyces sp. uw30]
MQLTDPDGEFIEPYLPIGPDSYLAGLHLRALMIWIKDLTRTAR